MQATITTFDNTAEGWERALYAFLAETERRSGSRHTAHSRFESGSAETRIRRCCVRFSDSRPGDPGPAAGGAQ